MLFHHIDAQIKMQYCHKVVLLTDMQAFPKRPNTLTDITVQLWLPPWYKGLDCQLLWIATCFKFGALPLTHI